jgi:hypothetical protein
MQQSREPHLFYRDKMIDIDYRGRDMDVVMNHWRKYGATSAMSLNARASDDARSLEEKARVN